MTTRKKILLLALSISYFLFAALGVWSMGGEPAAIVVFGTFGLGMVVAVILGLHQERLGDPPAWMLGGSDKFTTASSVIAFIVWLVGALALLPLLGPVSFSPWGMITILPLHFALLPWVKRNMR